MRITVKVKPQARSSALSPPASAGEPWQAQLKSPPVDGKANEELVALVARHFGCARSAVRIRSGQSGRFKQVEVDAKLPPGDDLKH